MIHLAMPVVNQHDLTNKCLQFINKAVGDPSQLHIIIIDNASDRPYRKEELDETSFRTTIVRNDANFGYYRPLLQAKEFATTADLVGLQHNDLFHYERAFEARLVNAFVDDPRLGCLGLLGSDEIDDRGGRGGGTMSNFRGDNQGQLQEHTGKRVTGKHPALILDSLFMLFRYPVVDFLCINKHTPLCHFEDKLMPVRAIAAGWRVAVLGLEIDHMGGQTSVLEGTRFEADAANWCRQEGIAFTDGQASLTLYLEAERRFLDYGRAMGFIPSRINSPGINPWVR